MNICSRINWLINAKFNNFEERGITSGGGLPSVDWQGIWKI